MRWWNGTAAVHFINDPKIPISLWYMVAKFNEIRSKTEMDLRWNRNIKNLIEQSLLVIQYTKILQQSKVVRTFQFC